MDTLSNGAISTERSSFFPPNFAVSNSSILGVFDEEYTISTVQTLAERLMAGLFGAIVWKNSTGRDSIKPAAEVEGGGT